MNIPTTFQFGNVETPTCEWFNGLSLPLMYFSRRDHYVAPSRFIAINNVSEGTHAGHTQANQRGQRLAFSVDSDRFRKLTFINNRIPVPVSCGTVIVL